MVSLAGKTLGKYRLIEQLGRGGFASVYKAYQARLDRYVAIKVLHPHLVEGEDFLARFEREAKSVAGLRHPNIVIVHDFDVEDNIYYMVMEYIDGQSLKQRLEELSSRDEHMPLVDINRIITDTSNALDYAHQQEMLHRDIKPSNVILNHLGDAFLTDFGIARILSNSQFTATGALIGTPAYMSPEQGQGMSLSPASDVYSLGVMLYEFITGRVPFDADTPLAIIFKHIRDPLPSIHTLRPGLPEGLERVVYKSLAKDPEDRFQNAGALVAALQEALIGDLKTGPRPEDLPTAASQPPSPDDGDVEHAVPPAMAEAVHPESEKAPTEPLISDVEGLPVESQVPREAIEPEVEEPELEASKLPTLAIDGEPLDLPETVISKGEELAPSTTELEAYKASTVAIESEPGTILEEAARLKDEGADAPPDKKRRPIQKILGIAGIILVCVIILGVVYTQIINPRTDETPAVIAVATALKPTTKPKATPKPKPTEIPGLAQFEHGMVLLHDERNYNEAIHKFIQAEELGFRSTDLYANLGTACLLAQNASGDCSFEQAIHYYNQAIENDPERAGQNGVYGGRCWAYLNIDRLQDAIEDCSRAIELEPDNPDSWVNRGNAYAKLGEKDAALADVSRAVEIDPKNPRYWADRAEIFAQVGNLEAAIEELSVAIELDPENSEYWWTRGWHLLEIDHPEAAIADFDQAISLRPDEIIAYIGRAHTHVRLGDIDAALQDLGNAIRVDPQHDGLYLERAHIFWWQLGDIDSAMQDLNTAIDLNPENYEAYVNRGEIYAYELEEPELGLENLNHAVEIAPRGVDLPFFVRGIFYNAIENWEAAIEDLSMGLRITPESPDGHGHRGYAFRQLGMVEKARADYEFFLEVTAENPEYEDWRREVEDWLSQNP